MKKYNAYCIVILLLSLIQVSLSGMQHSKVEQSAYQKKQQSNAQRRKIQKQRIGEWTYEFLAGLGDSQKMVSKDEIERYVKAKERALKAQKMVARKPLKVNNNNDLEQSDTLVQQQGQEDSDSEPDFMVDDDIPATIPYPVVDNKIGVAAEPTPVPVLTATQAPVQIASLAPAERSYFWQTLAGATGLTAVGMYIWYNFIYKTRNKEQSGELQSAPKAHVEKKS